MKHTDRIIAYLRDEPDGATASEISDALGIKRHRLWHHLRDLTSFTPGIEKIGERDNETIWRLIEDEDQRMTADNADEDEAAAAIGIEWRTALRRVLDLDRINDQQYQRDDDAIRSIAWRWYVEQSPCADSVDPTIDELKQELRAIEELDQDLVRLAELISEWRSDLRDIHESHEDVMAGVAQAAN